MTGPIRVLLADDDPLVLSGLKMMLGGAGQVQVVGEAHDGREVLPAVDLHHPDIVLMDIRMPRLDGIAATRLLRAQPSPPQVIVLTTFDADELVLRAAGRGRRVPAQGHRARRYRRRHPGRARRRRFAVARDCPPPHRPRRRGPRHGRPARAGPAPARLAHPCENQVAAAIAQGHSNAGIAAQLQMSLATVKAHVSRLLAKLGAENRVQIALLVQDATSRPHGPR
jgi:DNA-binding NarL/FixJ family response regulator